MKRGQQADDFLLAPIPSTPCVEVTAIMVSSPPLPVQQIFLSKLIREWQWKIFPLHKMKSNYDGSIKWCSCKSGHLCPRLGKCPRIQWGDISQYPEPNGVEVWLAEGHRNWGVHLGRSGLICVDVDPRSGGLASLEALTREHGKFPKTAKCLTGSGGIHFFYRAPSHYDPILGLCDEDGLSTSNFKLAPGVEVLSGQHFVVLPYSIHKSGNLYQPADFDSVHEWKDDDERNY